MESENGQNKLFIVLVASLVGLLVLGLVGIGGVFVLRQNMDQAIAAQSSPTMVIKLPPPVTPTPRMPESTNTPAPTPTSTSVIKSGEDVSPAAASNLQTDADSTVSDGESETANAGGSNDGSPTPKPSPTTATTPIGGNSSTGTAKTAVPNTGLNAFQTILVAIGLVTVLLVARRLRTS
jgi:cytoskeletal protein RodZ